MCKISLKQRADVLARPVLRLLTSLSRLFLILDLRAPVRGFRQFPQSLNGFIQVDYLIERRARWFFHV